MNFKMEYEKAFADISAGDDFKKQLANEMNRQKSVRTFPMRTVGMLAAAAALLLVVGAVYLSNVNGKIDGAGVDPEESLVAQGNEPSQGSEAVQNSEEVVPDTTIDVDQEMLAQEGNGNDYSQFHIADSAWYGDAQSDADKLKVFVELMSADTVETLYCSDEQTYAEEDIVPVEQAKLIADRVEEAADASTIDANSIQYYKAVLKDGKTIVFEVWDSSNIKIIGMETIYGLCR